MAASTFHKIKYYVNLDVTVDGVTASIRCYRLPGRDSRSSYTLLLGWRWMKQVRAIGDYGNDTYHIHDMAGYRYALEATIMASDIQGEIPQMCTNTHTHTGQPWDEESVSELRLSRNNLCKKLHSTIWDQVIEAVTEREADTDSKTDSEVTDSAEERESTFDADEESGSTEAEDSDDGSENKSHHKVPSIRVVDMTQVARI